MPANAPDVAALRAALAPFSPPTREWFATTFDAPTPVQARTWGAVGEARSVLVTAPTGSGKTLAAFLTALDRLIVDPPTRRPRRTRVLYVSPLKALAYDIDRNLRAPLVGIGHAAERLGRPMPAIDVGMRTGDTSAEDRRRMARHAPDILITTPESLFLLLTSRARETLAHVETVIVDEVHAVAGTKRGAHLAMSLERLEALRTAAAPDAPPLERIGLSATQRPVEEIARFLAGGTIDAAGEWQQRPATIVDVGATKTLDISIVVPVEDMSRLGEVMDEPISGPASGGGQPRRSIWPAVHPRVLELVVRHRSTIVFVNSRRLAERLCLRLNELHAEQVAAADASMAAGQRAPASAGTAADGSMAAGQRAPASAGTAADASVATVADIARAHHGSVAREQRLLIESELKAGRLKCVVATSSLELGIDMGAVDLVIQVESPGSVSSGLQRIGRAGHQVGAPSVGKVFPKYRGDLVECAVVVRRMYDGDIEETTYPRNPLDVLAQQIVAMAAMDSWPVDRLLATARSAASFADLSRQQLDGVLDMLSGRYPSDEFAELRPRITWDRIADVVTGRPSAQRLAVTSGGTIPDRGLYGVFIAGEGAGRRVGELDEEMVYETRPGETFMLGSSTWRIEDITRDQVLVTPAPGEPAKLPFWHGDALGRPVEVGRAVGAFLREMGGLPGEEAMRRLEQTYGLDPLAAGNLVRYLADQREATGVLPSDRTLVVERFRDEIGDWRVCLLSPFGGRVHAPWALAIESRARERLGLEVHTIWADDGIVVRLPEVDAPLSAGQGIGHQEQSLLDLVVVPPDDIEDLIVGELADSPLFASRFRECAARALLLPRRRPGGRTPLWQQRQRSADLLQVASRYGSFPILLETYRECLRDVFDVPALRDVLKGIAARTIRVAQIETPTASPFASSLLFDYLATSMYEGDAPLAERRAQALSLDRELLAELLGADELRELIDAAALTAVELELQRLVDDRKARGPDGVHDLLRDLGDLRDDEVVARTDAPPDEVHAWLAQLETDRRVYQLRVAGEARWAAVEDAARFRDAVGVPAAAGLPDAFLDPVERPLVDLVARFARTHGPFHAEDVSARLGIPTDAVALALKELDREGRVVLGEFRPAGSRREWCDAEVLRRLRRRSLAVLRKEVEPVEQTALGRFLPAWHGIDASRPGVERTLEAVEQLQGAPLPASTLDDDVMARRVGGYEPAWLDQLLASGEVVWLGRGPLGAGDGRVALYLRDQAPLLAPSPGDDPSGHEWWSEGHSRLLDHLQRHGASFWPGLYAAAGGGDPHEAVDALWDLVWAGLVTNDSLAPLRALTGGASPRARRRSRPGRVVSHIGPPRAAGRWSLTRELLLPEQPGTARAAALAAQLLDRHGVVTRDTVATEEIAGGFSAVYPVLKAMEESGRCRRGYFVEGLGGAQFAMPGAVDRLRAVRSEADEESPVTIMAATDPANPYGAVLPWPAEGATGQRPRRIPGAYVVLVDGALTLWLGKGGGSLLTFASDAAVLATSVEAVAAAVLARRLPPLQVKRIDGAPVQDQPLLDSLRGVGFADHPRGMVLRAGSAAVGRR